MRARREAVFCAGWLLLACVPAPPGTPDPVATQPPAAAEPARGVESTQLEQRSVVAAFSDAVVYAGATHFYFTLPDGEELRVVESNDPGAPVIANTDVLFDPSPDEGPPGPNPALLGQYFRIVYDADGRVVTIDPLPE